MNDPEFFQPMVLALLFGISYDIDYIRFGLSSGVSTWRLIGRLLMGLFSLVWVIVAFVSLFD